MVLVVVRGGPLMLVCGKAVLVLGMIVICVLVDVLRRELAGGRGQNQSEQDRCEAMHRYECMGPRQHGQTAKCVGQLHRLMRPATSQ
jgi:hypothetical protein